MVSQFYVRYQALLTVWKVITSLWMEVPAVSLFASADFPMIELQPVDSSDDDDDDDDDDDENHNER
jgi:hypothetical protein